MSKPAFEACRDGLDQFSLAQVREIARVSQEIEKQKAQTAKGALEILEQKNIAYLDPTYDKTFKWLMSQKNEGIARTIFDSLVFLAYKGLETRQVQSFQSMSQQLDAMTEQLKHLPNSNFQALTMDVPVALDFGDKGVDMPAVAPRHDLGSAVDEIVRTLRALPAGKNIDESLNDPSQDISTRDGLIEKLNGLKALGAGRIEEKGAREVVRELQKWREVWVDIEMQRSQQREIEARMLQYGAVMLLSQRASGLLPLLLVSICQWENSTDESVVVSDVFHALINRDSENPVPVSQVTVNIQKLENPVTMDENKRKAEFKRIKDVFKNFLRGCYPELTRNVGSFKELVGDGSSEEQGQLRTAYEVLCFLRLAPLMPQLQGGGRDKEVVKKEGEDFQSQTRVFNPTIREAYNIMEVCNSADVPGAGEQYLGIWDSREVAVRAEAQLLAERERAEARSIDAMVDSVFAFLPYISQKGAQINAVSEWAQDTFSKLDNVEIGKKIITKLSTRQVEAQVVGIKIDIAEVAQGELDRVVREGGSGPSTPSRTTREAQAPDREASPSSVNTESESRRDPGQMPQTSPGTPKAPVIGDETDEKSGGESSKTSRRQSIQRSEDRSHQGKGRGSSGSQSSTKRRAGRD